MSGGSAFETCLRAASPTARKAWGMREMMEHATKDRACARTSDEHAKGRIPNPERRTTARSQRSGRVRRLAAACVFLLAAAVVPSFPAPARAADTTLVSNFSNDRENSGADLAGTDYAQGFQTGDNAAGYTVSEIDLKFDTASRTRSWPIVTLVKDSVTGTDTTTLAPRRIHWPQREWSRRYIYGSGGHLARSIVDLLCESHVRRQPS